MLSLSGLATFGTAAVEGYNAKKSALKTEAERLADKQREQTRQDAAEQRANESHTLQQDTGLYALGQKKTEDTQKLEEFNRTKLIRDGVGSALTAYQAGDLSGAYDAYEQTGNKLHPERQMRFERDANGLIVIDPKTKSAVGQVYDASGNPMGQKMPIAMTQLHSAISSMADPIKYAESRQTVADAIETETRQLENNKKLKTFDNALPMSQADDQKIRLQQQINNQNAARDHGYGNENAARDYGYDVDKLNLQYGLKADAAANSAGTTGSSKSGKGPSISALDPSLASISTADVMPFLFGAESNGQHRQPNGQLTTSPKGAQGVGQLMPATQADAGYGVRPPRDNSEAENKRFSTEYLQAMRNQFKGRPDELALGLASYNAGIGNVQKALAKQDKQGGHWSQYLPKPQETVPYVEKIMAGLSSNQARAINQGRNQAAAGIMSGNVEDLNKMIVSDFKDQNEPVSGATVTVGLNRAINSFTKMQRVPDADKQTHFVAGLTEIIRMLPDDMSDADKQTYANSVAYKLLGEGSFQSMSSRLYPNNGQQSAPSGSPAAADQQLVNNPVSQNQPPATAQKPATVQAKPEPAPFSPDAMKAGMSYLTADLTDLTPKEQAKPEPKLKLPTKKADPAPVAQATASTITMDSPKDDLAKRVAKREAAAKQAALRAAAEQQRLEKAKAEQKAQAIADAKAKTKDDEERKKRRQSETTQTRSTLILPMTGNKWMAQ